MLKFALLFLFCAMTACSNDGGRGSTARGSANGGLAFKAVWPHPDTQASRIATATTEGTPNVCAAFGIETITAKVLDEAGTERGAGSWPCETQDHRGTIDDIPVGHNYRVIVQGMVAGEPAWQGEARDISIEGNKTTTIEKIIMHTLDYVLTASSSDGGRISPAGSIAVSAISIQTFSFIPDSDYRIEDVIIDGTSHGPMEQYTFSSIKGSHTIYVSFVPTSGTRSTHTVMASAGGGGAIVPEGRIQVIEGNDQEFTILPATGNHITDVFVDEVSLGAMTSYTFKYVRADHTIRVAFDTSTYTINAMASPGGQIDPAGNVTAAYGSKPAFTITADAGYYLAGLRINGVDAPPQNTYAFEPVTGDGTIAAVFKPVRYVDAGAQAGGDGTSWENAFPTLTEAIQTARDGDDIWVKAGTYLITGQISVNKAIALYGGHTGTERYAHERSWQDNPTIIDAQGQTRAFYISADARMDGLIIQNGNLNTGLYNLQGAALFIDNSSPTIANCAFRNNHIGGNSCAGGAVYAGNSTPLFDNCRFEYNDVDCEFSKGGAMHLNACNTIISGCTFNNNTLGWATNAYGGSIEIEGGTAVITGSRFLASDIEGESTLGGAISSNGAKLTLSECLFQKNRINGNSTGKGGAIYLNGSNAEANPVIHNTIFLGNSAGREDMSGTSQGGALFNENVAPAIVNCTFSKNVTTARSTSQGGAIANVSGNPTITNTILWGNHAYIDTSSGVSDGSGMQIYDDASSQSTVAYSIVDGSVPDGNYNLNQEPQLDEFGHLQAGSVGLEAGNDAAAPDTDFDGETRPRNGRSDIGADEFVDDEADQLPDYWEKYYGLDIARDDSGEDPDDDGLSNRVEYRLGLNPTLANPSAAAQHRGWYDETGWHDAADNSTRCGASFDTEHRSYFTFELPTVSGSVVGAILRLELVEYQSIRQAETFTVYDVTTDPATLEASGSGKTAVYNDLGGGVTYSGQVTVSPDDVGKIISVVLSDMAVADINAALGGSFAIGIRPTSAASDETDIFTFSQASETRTHQLVLIVE